MSAVRRKFTTEQKIQILRQAKESGIIKVLQLNKLSYSVFVRWKQQLQKEAGTTYDNTTQLQQIEALQTENLRLKKIVANQALELEVMNERRISNI
jgi:putative transposase